MRLGFAGLGLMGRPMAANLLRSGRPLVVFNRSRPARDELVGLGARAVDTPTELFAGCDCILLMLADDQAVDAVLGRGPAGITEPIAGKIIVNLSTHAPEWSLDLQRHIIAADARYVEAPVSGSTGPAKAGALVAMLAGEPEVVTLVRPLLEPLCRQIVETGPVPSALRCKLAVNLYLIATVAALAEAARLATLQGLDLGPFGDVIGSGPLGSDVARSKLSRMASGDFAPQASIRDVCKNAGLVAEAASATHLDAGLLREARRRFEAVLAAGGGDLDMAAVITTFGPDRAVT